MKTVTVQTLPVPQDHLDFIRDHIPPGLREPRSLRQKQSLFAFLLAYLIDHAYDLGFEVTVGDVWRPDGKGHMKGSLHYVKLAADLNLFRGGKWQKYSEAHKPLGEFWEALHPLCRWGGRFGDGNHYSVTHGGKK